METTSALVLSDSNPFSVYPGSYSIPISLNAVWIACHYMKRLGKKQVVEADIKHVVNEIVDFIRASNTSLRVTGALLVGVTRLYNKKLEYFQTQCSDVLKRMRLSTMDINISQSTTVVKHRRSLSSMGPGSLHSRHTDHHISQNRSMDLTDSVPSCKLPVIYEDDSDIDEFISGLTHPINDPDFNEELVYEEITRQFAVDSPKDMGIKKRKQQHAGIDYKGFRNISAQRQQQRVAKKPITQHLNDMLAIPSDSELLSMSQNTEIDSLDSQDYCIEPRGNIIDSTLSASVDQIELLNNVSIANRSSPITANVNTDRSSRMMTSNYFDQISSQQSIDNPQNHKHHLGHHLYTPLKSRSNAQTIDDDHLTREDNEFGMPFSEIGVVFEDIELLSNENGTKLNSLIDINKSFEHGMIPGPIEKLRGTESHIIGTPLREETQHVLHQGRDMNTLLHMTAGRDLGVSDLDSVTDYFPQSFRRSHSSIEQSDIFNLRRTPDMISVNRDHIDEFVHNQQNYSSPQSSVLSSTEIFKNKYQTPQQFKELNRASLIPDTDLSHLSWDIDQPITTDSISQQQPVSYSMDTPIVSNHIDTQDTIVENVIIEVPEYELELPTSLDSIISPPPVLNHQSIKIKRHQHQKKELCIIDDHTTLHDSVIQDWHASRMDLCRSSFQTTDEKPLMYISTILPPALSLLDTIHSRDIFYKNKYDATIPIKSQSHVRRSTYTPRDSLYFYLASIRRQQLIYSDWVYGHVHSVLSRAYTHTELRRQHVLKKYSVMDYSTTCSDKNQEPQQSILTSITSLSMSKNVSTPLNHADTADDHINELESPIIFYEHSQDIDKNRNMLNNHEDPKQHIDNAHHITDSSTLCIQHHDMGLQQDPGLDKHTLHSDPKTGDTTQDHRKNSKKTSMSQISNSLDSPEPLYSTTMGLYEILHGGHTTPKGTHWHSRNAYDRTPLKTPFWKLRQEKHHELNQVEHLQSLTDVFQLESLKQQEQCLLSSPTSPMCRTPTIQQYRNESITTYSGDSEQMISDIEASEVYGIELFNQTPINRVPPGSELNSLQYYQTDPINLTQKSNERLPPLILMSSLPVKKVLEKEMGFSRRTVRMFQYISLQLSQTTLRIPRNIFGTSLHHDRFKTTSDSHSYTIDHPKSTRVCTEKNVERMTTPLEELSQPALSFNSLLLGQTRDIAAAVFFELLALKTRMFIHLQQGQVPQDIVPSNSMNSEDIYITTAERYHDLLSLAQPTVSA